MKVVFRARSQRRQVFQAHSDLSIYHPSSQLKLHLNIMNCTLPTLDIGLQFSRSVSLSNGTSSVRERLTSSQESSNMPV